MKPKCSPKDLISRDPKDLDAPANAPCFYESPDGDRLIDGNKPDHGLENLAERISVLTIGDTDRILKYYTDLYYNRLARRRSAAQDDAADNSDRKETSVTEMRSARLPIPADEALRLLRGLKEKVCRLEKQKVLLSQAAADSGCPDTATPDCPIKEMKAGMRRNPVCAECWQRYADATIRLLPSKNTGTLPA